jgi:seryl-tRNA synthetase
MNVAFKTSLKPSIPLDAMAEALFQPTGIDGVYGRTAIYERIVEGLSALITQQREPDTEILRFPPVMNRRHLEKSGYLKSFPHLLGCVSCLSGSEPEIRAVVDRFDAGGEWTSALSAAEVVLSPAACYPIYPLVASRGRIPSSGLLFDVACDCFRHEPSRDLDRLQSFRMREYVRIGTPAQILEFRERWMSRALEIADRLGLNYRVDQASDPFFGRGGTLAARSQIEQSLKFELLIPVRSAEEPTACMSFNYHQDHFGKTWQIHDESGEVAHTGCVAFGIDRLALALFSAHGLDLPRWPATVRTALSI